MTRARPLLAGARPLVQCGTRRSGEGVESGGDEADGGCLSTLHPLLLLLLFPLDLLLLLPLALLVLRHLQLLVRCDVVRLSAGVGDGSLRWPIEQRLWTCPDHPSPQRPQHALCTSARAVHSVGESRSWRGRAGVSQALRPRCPPAVLAVLPPPSPLPMCRPSPTPASSSPLLTSTCTSTSPPPPPLLPSLLLVPPLRYELIEERLHRGSYPTLRNLPFLSRLHLKTLLSLTSEPPTPDLTSFAQAEASSCTTSRCRSRWRGWRCRARFCARRWR